MGTLAAFHRCLAPFQTAVSAISNHSATGWSFQIRCVPGNPHALYKAATPALGGGGVIFVCPMWNVERERLARRSFLKRKEIRSPPNFLSSFQSGLRSGAGGGRLGRRARPSVKGVGGCRGILPAWRAGLVGGKSLCLPRAVGSCGTPLGWSGEVSLSPGAQAGGGVPTCLAHGALSQHHEAQGARRAQAHGAPQRPREAHARTCCRRRRPRLLPPPGGSAQRRGRCPAPPGPPLDGPWAMSRSSLLPMKAHASLNQLISSCQGDRAASPTCTSTLLKLPLRSAACLQMYRANHLSPFRNWPDRATPHTGAAPAVRVKLGETGQLSKRSCGLRFWDLFGSIPSFLRETVSLQAIE